MVAAKKHVAIVKKRMFYPSLRFRAEFWPGDRFSGWFIKEGGFNRAVGGFGTEYRRKGEAKHHRSIAHGPDGLEDILRCAFQDNS